MTNQGQEGQWPQQPGGDPNAGWQGTPQQGMPAQGTPQGYQPTQAFPQGGYPQGTAPQGFPQGTPPQGFPQTGYGYPMPQQPPQRKSKRGLIIGLVIALVALLGGGGTWWALAQRDSVASGAANPTEAVQNLAKSVGNNDVVGMLGTLAPAEAKLFTDPVGDATNELKRLQILKPDADPKALSGVQIKAENLQFDQAGAENVKDHVTITKLTGGTLTVTADFSKAPLAKEFLDSVLSSSERREMERPRTETVDIAKEVRESGEPVRIATVKVDGEWYPSLLYTVADYALRENRTEWPKDSIPANGAGSPNEAVKQLVQASLDGNLRRVIELLPPDEMAVLHDAGPAILRAAGANAKPTGAKLNKLETANSPMSGGTRATLTALEVTDPSGETFSLTRSGDCYQMSVGGKSEQLCADQFAEMLGEEFGERDQAMQSVLRNLGTGVLKQGIGVVTTEAGGKHYVSPIRTVNELGMTILRSLQPADIKAMTGGR